MTTIALTKVYIEEDRSLKVILSFPTACISPQQIDLPPNSSNEDGEDIRAISAGRGDEQVVYFFRTPLPKGSTIALAIPWWMPSVTPSHSMHVTCSPTSGLRVIQAVDGYNWRIVGPPHTKVVRRTTRSADVCVRFATQCDLSKDDVVYSLLLRDLERAFQEVRQRLGLPRQPLVSVWVVDVVSHVSPESVFITQEGAILFSCEIARDLSADFDCPASRLLYVAVAEFCLLYEKRVCCWSSRCTSWELLGLAELLAMSSLVSETEALHPWMCTRFIGHAHETTCELEALATQRVYVDLYRPPEGSFERLYRAKAGLVVYTLLSGWLMLPKPIHAKECVSRYIERCQDSSSSFPHQGLIDCLVGCTEPLRIQIKLSERNTEGLKTVIELVPSRDVSLKKVPIRIRCCGSSKYEQDDAEFITTLTFSLGHKCEVTLPVTGSHKTPDQPTSIISTKEVILDPLFVYPLFQWQYPEEAFQSEEASKAMGKQHEQIAVMLQQIIHQAKYPTSSVRLFKVNLLSPLTFVLTATKDPETLILRAEMLHAEMQRVLHSEEQSTIPIDELMGQTVRLGAAIVERHTRWSILSHRTDSPPKKIISLVEAIVSSTQTPPDVLARVISYASRWDGWWGLPEQYDALLAYVTTQLQDRFPQNAELLAACLCTFGCWDRWKAPALRQLKEGCYRQQRVVLGSIASREDLETFHWMEEAKERESLNAFVRRGACAAVRRAAPMLDRLYNKTILEVVVGRSRVSLAHIDIDARYARKVCEHATQEGSRLLVSSLTDSLDKKDDPPRDFSWQCFYSYPYFNVFQSQSVLDSLEGKVFALREQGPSAFKMIVLSSEVIATAIPHPFYFLHHQQHQMMRSSSPFFVTYRYPQKVILSDGAVNGLRIILNIFHWAPALKFFSYLATDAWDRLALMYAPGQDSIVLMPEKDAQPIYPGFDSVEDSMSLIDISLPPQSVYLKEARLYVVPDQERGTGKELKGVVPLGLLQEPIGTHRLNTSIAPVLYLSRCTLHVCPADPSSALLPSFFILLTGRHLEYFLCLFRTTLGVTVRTQDAGAPLALTLNISVPPSFMSSLDLGDRGDTLNPSSGPPYVGRGDVVLCVDGLHIVRKDRYVRGGVLIGVLQEPEVVLSDILVSTQTVVNVALR